LAYAAINVVLLSVPRLFTQKRTVCLRRKEGYGSDNVAMVRAEECISELQVRRGGLQTLRPRRI